MCYWRRWYSIFWSKSGNSFGTSLKKSFGSGMIEDSISRPRIKLDRQPFNHMLICIQAFNFRSKVSIHLFWITVLSPWCLASECRYCSLSLLLDFSFSIWLKGTLSFTFISNRQCTIKNSQTKLFGRFCTHLSSTLFLPTGWVALSSSCPMIT